MAPGVVSDADGGIAVVSIANVGAAAIVSVTSAVLVRPSASVAENRRLCVPPRSGRPVMVIVEPDTLDVSVSGRPVTVTVVLRPPAQDTEPE